jgi:hypothetical protein
MWPPVGTVPAGRLFAFWEDGWRVGLIRDAEAGTRRMLVRRYRFAIETIRATARASDTSCQNSTGLRSIKGTKR